MRSPPRSRPVREQQPRPGVPQVRFLAVTDPGGLLGLFDEVGMPAAARRLPGADGVPVAEEIRRWNDVGPRYGLEVLGPPLPEGS